MSEAQKGDTAEILAALAPIGELFVSCRTLRLTLPFGESGIPLDGSVMPGPRRPEVLADTVQPSSAPLNPLDDDDTASDEVFV